MPYRTNSDLPAQVRNALPDDAQSRWRAVVNSALARGLSDAKAFGSGWTVIRNGWQKPKDGGKWVHKAAEPRTLFASRPVENAQDLIDWAKGQGFPTTLQPDAMHVTQAYSKEPMQWPEALDDTVTVNDTPGRKVGPLGDQGAMVLHFDSPALSDRHQQLREAGASSDYPTYQPHITISWKADGVDPNKVTPYTGPLVLGPERFREIDPEFSPDQVTEKMEKYNEAHDAAGRFTYGSGSSGASMELGSRALATRSPNATAVATANDNISQKDKAVGAKVRDWLAKPAREKLADSLSSIKEHGVNLATGTARETVVIGAVETIMHHFLPGIPHQLTLPAAAALTHVIGNLASKLGLSEHGIKAGLKKGVDALISARKTALTLSRVQRASQFGVADVASGRVLTKDDQDVGVVLMFKADAVSEDADDAVLHWLHGLLDQINAYQPKGGSARLDANNATRHVNRLHEVTDMHTKANPNHDEQGRFSSGGGGGDGGGGVHDAQGRFRIPDEAIRQAGSGIGLVAGPAVMAAMHQFSPGKVPSSDSLAATISRIATRAKVGGGVIRDAMRRGFKAALTMTEAEAHTLESTLTFKADNKAWLQDMIDALDAYEPDAELEKAGARHNASDRQHVQAVHDSAVHLGADCPGMSKRDDLDDERFEKFDALTTVNEAGESVSQASVIKVDDGLGLVFGWAMICKDGGNDYYDVQDDHIPEDAMLKASTEFMLSRRVAKEMHFGDEQGTIVFAFPVTADVAKAMNISTDRTGLMIAMKPSSEALLEKFRSGEYTGFSIGGQRLVDEEMAA